MSSHFSGKLFLIIGSSGVGKGTTISALKKRHPEWIFPVSVTTRSPRPGEQSGETYRFFSQKEFLKKRENDEFIEWACVHGKHFYGTLKKEIFTPLSEGKTVVREIDIQGFKSIRNLLPPENLYSIFLLPPPREDLIRRIRARAPISDEELEARLQSMKREEEWGEECDTRIQTQNGEMMLPVLEIEKKVIEWRSTLV